MIDFLRYRYVCAAFSLLMMASFVGLFIHKRATVGQAFNYSVEFSGGTQVIFKFDQKMSSAHIVEILAQEGWSGAITREFSENEILVRVKEYSNDTVGLGQRLKVALEKHLPATKVEILQIDGVGQGVGEALVYNSFKAVVLSLIAMLLYIGFRFWSLSFGLGAVISLFHDAIAILLFFMLFDKEISINVIGAILAVLGYSINDTIVIFTQIRDQFSSVKNMSKHQIVNLSLNQTLRRTTLTSFATTLIVVALLALGGESLRDLSLALFIGIVFGTYSSIYIASPVMLLFEKK